MKFFLVLLLMLPACRTTELRACDIILNPQPPGGVLRCKERDIPIDRVKAWIRKCAEEHQP